VIALLCGVALRWVRDGDIGPASRSSASATVFTFVDRFNARQWSAVVALFSHDFESTHDQKEDVR
jgi:hypothetical protein